MSRVDFYILSDGLGSSETSVHRFACNITAKAWHQGNRVHIHTRSENLSNTMDDLLWTYRDISFIPHEKFNGNEHEDTPVTIGSDNSFPESAQVMINLGNEIPAFANNFDRIVEIVGGDETHKQYARQRYRQYKETDVELHNHKIDKLKEYA